MKYIILFLIPFLSFSQQDVPDKYWIQDSNFEKVNKKPNSPNVGTDKRDKHSLLRERRLVRKQRLRQKGVA